MKTQTVKLIALRPFLHGYGVLSVGDPFVTTLGHAKQLLHLGYAREEGVFAPVTEAGVDLLAFRSAAPASQAAAALELPVLPTFAAPADGDVAPASKAGAEGALSGQSAEFTSDQQIDLAGGGASAGDGDGAAAAAPASQASGVPGQPAPEGGAASSASAAAGDDAASASKAGAESASSGQSAEVAGAQQVDLAGGTASTGDEGGAAAAAKPAESRGRRQAG